MKHKILIATALIFFSACMKVKKKEDGAPPVAAQTQVLQGGQLDQQINARTELDYKYDVSETGEFDKVHFFAPKHWDSGVILKKQIGVAVSESAITFNDQAEWTDNLIPGEKISYQFYASIGKDGKEPQLLGEAEVLPVLDLKNVNEDVNLYQLYKISEKTKVIHIRNLEIQPQKHLFLENFSGTIVVDHLKTNNGFIQTFPMDHRAPDDQDGQSGGQVNLVINDGDGELVVLMKGQNGGNGSPAKEPDPSMNGAEAPRTPGADFSEDTVISFEGSSGQFFSIPKTTYSCIKPPGAASNGNSGLQGNPGHPGRNGGNSGTVKILTLDNDVKIDLHSVAGLGGQLTKGSPGGEGGPPGGAADGNLDDLFFWLKKNHPAIMLNTTLANYSRESYSIVRPCNKSSLGMPGQPGEPGSSGMNDGQPGIIQSSYINSVKQ